MPTLGFNNCFSINLLTFNLTKFDSLVCRSKANAFIFGKFFYCYPFHAPKVENILLYTNSKVK